MTRPIKLTELLDTAPDEETKQIRWLAWVLRKRILSARFVVKRLTRMAAIPPTDERRRLPWWCQ